MEKLGQDLLAIAAVGILVSLLQAVAPGEQGKRAVKLAGSLLLLLVVLAPLPGLGEKGLSQLVTAAVEELRQTGGGVSAEGENQIAAGITRRCTAYIWDKATELGMSVEAEVQLTREDGWPYPAGAVLRGTWTEQQRQALAELLEQELGIPMEEQEWKHE